MKLVKILEQVLNEKLGVPDGILEAAENLCKDIIRGLVNYESDENKIEGGFNMSFEADPHYKIGDLTIVRVGVSFEIYIGRRFYIEGMSVPNRNIAHNELYLTINLTIPPNWDYSDIADVIIEEERTKFISSLSHELMHWFDHEKRKNITNKSTLAKYDYRNISKDLRDIHPINNFIYLLYFTHYIENSVRSTEFASKLKSEKVTRKNFLEFLKNDDTYFALNQAKNFSYEKLKDDLKNYIPEIDKFFKEVGMDKDFKKYNIVLQTDKEKIDEFLKNIKMVIEVYAVSYFNELKKFDMLKDFGIKKETSDNVFLKSVGKFNSVDAFYKHGEKMLNSFGDKMIRKISKLYDMVDDK